ncbi:hypothetical protein CQW23_34690 [Capsicum baccatum]|uniref:Uncharacterized protein n=1 Tax=Capsicum baccatum TaxID=33114 RepID=A0A2G2UY63_CAPBA|nr:hypothetical protein CQW23_34690 [Capsicum baccatum]
MLTLEPFSEDQGRSAVHPSGRSHQSASLRLTGYSPVDSHTFQTPWSVFQDGSNGEPTGQRPERADAEARRMRALPATIEETSEHLSAKGSWSPDERRVVAATAKRVELQPPLVATSVDVDSHLGQPRARGAREASIRPAMTARLVIEARCEGATQCVMPRQTCPRPNGFGSNLRSKN